MGRSSSKLKHDTVVEAIYCAAGDETLWSQALGRAAESVQAAGAILAFFRKEPSPAIGALYSSGFTADDQIRYVTRTSFADPHLPLVTVHGDRRWVFSQDHFDERFIARNEFFEHVMKPLGIRWVAGSMVWQSEEALAAVAFQRPADAPHYGSFERRSLAGLTAHLHQAARLHWILSERQTSAALGLAALDRLDLGMAVFDTGTRLLFANERADRWFARGDLVRCRGRDRLSLRHPGCDASFRAAITGACQLHSVTLDLLDECGQAVAHASVVPLPPEARPNALWQRPLALVVMRDAGGGPPASQGWGIQRYGFTAAEQRLVDWLLTGASLEAYSQAQGLSKETARTQLKAAMAKSGTSRQAELVALLARQPTGLLSRG